VIKSLSKLLFASALLFLITGVFFAPKAHAVLTNISDTITTSRPSAAALIDNGYPITANATQATIDDNGLNMFLASDSAVIYPEAGETIDTGKNIGSMSNANIPSAGLRTVYLTGPCAGYGCFASKHHGSEALVVNVTAMHTIKFTTSTPIPNNQTIVLSFPNAGANWNIASPSATGFSFNGLAQGQITCWEVTGAKDCQGGTGGGTGGSYTPSANTITITLGNTGAVAAGDTVIINIGCSGHASGICNNQTPRLINPAKSAVTGTADLWKLQLQVANTNNDSAKVTIGTIESVQVQATVDPTLTFTIAPKQAVDGAPTSWNNYGNCTSGADVANSGINSGATNVNLGILNTTNINIAYQLITISTNASRGYALTATSSGHLMDPSSGFALFDTATPTVVAGVNHPWFGIHACGLEANTTPGNWGNGIAGVAAKFAWPTISTPLAIASIGTGPIGNVVGAGGLGAGLTAIEYAAAVDITVPAGNYASTITYTATPTF
jgi:hypothetical protein